MKKTSKRPIALVTGASRKAGIGSAIATSLAEAGWDVAVSYWLKYDAAMPWGANKGEVEKTLSMIRGFGA
ncbi:MAG: short-chain dehydrogenase, partial [Candidatus Firestonebacteria bacterium]